MIEKAELARQWLLGYSLLGPNRAWFGTRLGRKGIRELARMPALQVIQAETAHDIRLWRLLNDEFFSLRPDVTLRVFPRECDLGFLRQMPYVRRFSADCMFRATDVDAVAALPNLEDLRIGVFELKDFNFLELIPDTLTSLSLEQTFSAKPSLAPIRRFRGLRTLYLEGQQKGIEGIGSLSQLEDLTLRSISTPNIDYLSGLENLWSLDIKLGSIKDFSVLRRMPSVKYLELWMVRGLADVSFISDMTGLQKLFLENLPNVLAIPDLSKLDRLRSVTVEGMRGLADVSNLSTAPNLEQVLCIAPHKLNPQDFAPLLERPALRYLCVGFGSTRKNMELERMIDRAGKESTWPIEFRFEQ